MTRRNLRILFEYDPKACSHLWIYALLHAFVTCPQSSANCLICIQYAYSIRLDDRIRKSNHKRYCKLAGRWSTRDIPKFLSILDSNLNRYGSSYWCYIALIKQTIHLHWPYDLTDKCAWICVTPIFHLKCIKCVAGITLWNFLIFFGCFSGKWGLGNLIQNILQSTTGKWYNLEWQT